MARNEPAGGLIVVNGSPQHAIVRSVWMPHECAYPRASDVNFTGGGSASRQVSFPQQDTVASGRSPQAWKKPVAIDDSASGGATPSPRRVFPQHVRAPSRPTAHVASAPEPLPRPANEPPGGWWRS